MIVVVCLTLTATFAVFRPPAVTPQDASQLVFTPGYSSVQSRPARIPPLRFQIAVGSGTASSALLAPGSYTRPCACSHTNLFRA